MSSIKEQLILNESQCDNLETRSSDKLRRIYRSQRANTRNTEDTTSVEKTTIEIIEEDSYFETESANNNNSQSYPNRNSSSSFIETIQFPNKLENSIHRRYIDYFNLSQEKKDSSKTDYTYAHSFSYSDNVPIKKQFNWLVPNMSRQSLSSARRQSAQDRQTNTETTSTSSKTSSYNRKSSQRSSTFEMAGSLSNLSPNGKTKTHKKAQPEYSDDDEDYALTQPKVNGIRPKKYNPSTTSNQFDYNDDDDYENDEELNYYRRITRYITRTYRKLANKNEKNEAISFTESKSSTLKASKSNIFTNRHLSLFLLCLFLLGSFYFIPEQSKNHVRQNIYDAWTITSTKVAGYFPPKAQIEYRNGDHIIAEIERLRSEVENLRLNSEKGKQEASAKSAPIVNMPDFDNILLRLDEIERKVSSCCNKKPQEIDAVMLEANITRRVHDLMKQSFDSSYKTLQNSIDAHVIAEMKNLENKITQLVNDRMKQFQNDVSSSIQTPSGIPADLAIVQEMIRKAILKYDADKTGETDFALESAGAWIISTRCSETYQFNSASYKLFGVTMWKSNNSPRVVIQPGVVPGECWCFKGNEGRLGIHLSANIIPSGFTYEHIPVSISRDGHIRSAPQSFAVYGLKTDDDLSPELLGEYIFDIDSDESLQRFKVQNHHIATHGFDKIELLIKSNHGHPEYTCLYRFRVHGQVHNDTTK